MIRATRPGRRPSRSQRHRAEVRRHADRAERLAEIEALAVGAAECLDRVGLRTRLDALCDSRQAERARQPDDRLDEDRVHVGRRQAVDERCAIFSWSSGNSRRCASDEWPVPKSSRASRTPSIAQPPRPRGCSGLRISDALGDLQHEALRREAGLDEHLRDLVRRARGRASWRGERLTFSRGRQRRAAPATSRAWRQASRRTQSPERHDQPGLLGDGMNWPGGTSPRAGWIQRTSASTADDAARSRGRRWAGSARRARRARSALAGRSRAPGAPRPARASAARRHAKLRLAAALGLVHGHVGVAEQRRRPLVRRARGGDADAGA